jgi:hypothetical protein
MTIGEIFIKLGFHADTFTLKDFSKALGELPMKAVTSALGIAGVSLEVASLVKNAMEAANGFQMFTSITGESSRELQRWQNVAKQAGMSGQEVTGAFVNVDNAIKRMKSGAGGADLGNAFGWLKEDWKNKNADQILNDIRKAIPQMTPKQIAWAQTRVFPALGIDSGMIMRLGQMKDFNSRANAVPIMDEAQIKAVAELQTAFAKLAGTVEHSVVPLMEELANAINKVLPTLKSWLDTEVSSIQKILHMTDEDSKTLDDYINGPDPDDEKFQREHPGGLAGDWFRKTFNTSLGKSATGPVQASAAEAAIAEAKFLAMMKDLVPSGGGPRVGGEARDLNLIQHIYSTGDPAAVAYHAIAEADRRLTQTSKHFANGGT